jgi:hypothetical protein
MAEAIPSQPKIGPASAVDIEYRAFARDFGDGAVVLSVVACRWRPGPATRRTF